MKSNRFISDHPEFGAFLKKNWNSLVSEEKHSVPPVT